MCVPAEQLGLPLGAQPLLPERRPSPGEVPGQGVADGLFERARPAPGALSATTLARASQPGAPTQSGTPIQGLTPAPGNAWSLTQTSSEVVAVTTRWHVSRRRPSVVGRPGRVEGARQAPLGSVHGPRGEVRASMDCAGGRARLGRASGPLAPPAGASRRSRSGRAARRSALGARRAPSPRKPR